MRTQEGKEEKSKRVKHSDEEDIIASDEEKLNRTGQATMGDDNDTSAGSNIENKDEQGNPHPTPFSTSRGWGEQSTTPKAGRHKTSGMKLE